MNVYKAVFLLGAVICNGGSTVHSQLTCAFGDGTGYRGTIAVTWSGKKCQRWSDQCPHQHHNSPQDKPNSGLESNYCRNPDGEPRPWCYTTDPNTRWEYCLVPRCENSPGIELDCTTGDGGAYRGSIAETWTGRRCQSWSVQSPHEHSYTPQNYPTSDLESNYCRNPDGEAWPWCYTTYDGIRWEYCNVPMCGISSAPELTCASGNGEAYRGTLSKTRSGRTCQKWSDQAPHSHDYTTQKYPRGGLVGNFCRNPDNSKKPWCYTTDPDLRWDYCTVASCGK
ncbi:plasminogen-like [Betta splendens]|uniref:Plasminogen-like n=1 Tax=Betta splendens TaxID=158456 RepID=A0A6P7LQS0_BETSP|nr:plasminogen-like [Betta splendens]